jgi:hypothetical protein
MTSTFEQEVKQGDRPEVAKAEEIFLFYRDMGFVLKNLLTDGGGLGNNQFVLAKPNHD